MAMESNIPPFVNHLPECLKELHNSAVELASNTNELNLQYIDSSVYLLALLQQDDMSSSTLWLHSTGLTGEVVIEKIIEDFDQRSPVELVYNEWDEQRPEQVNVNFTQKATKMFSYLEEHRRTRHVKAGVYFDDILKAIVLSDSRTVEKIFGSVGLSMSDVRFKLHIVTVEDLERTFNR
jgi:hypothetical protein